MVGKIFLLGRPGSGKTTAFQHLKSWADYYNLQAVRFREYAILYEMFKSGRSEFRATDHGGFDILDFSILNESAKRLEKLVRTYIDNQVQENELLFIELARADYQQTLQQCFQEDFLQNSHFLFIEASVETCIKRIYRRVGYPGTTDGHFISEHILKSHYPKNNYEYMVTRFQAEYGLKEGLKVIKNNGSREELAMKLWPFAETLFTKALSNIDLARQEQKLFQGKTTLPTPR